MTRHWTLKERLVRLSKRVDADLLRSGVPNRHESRAAHARGDREQRDALGRVCELRRGDQLQVLRGCVEVEEEAVPGRGGDRQLVRVVGHQAHRLCLVRALPRREQRGDCRGLRDGDPGEPPCEHLDCGAVRELERRERGGRTLEARAGGDFGERGVGGGEEAGGAEEGEDEAAGAREGPQAGGRCGEGRGAEGQGEPAALEDAEERG